MESIPAVLDDAEQTTIFHDSRLLDSHFVPHSLFVCPVSKELCNPREDPVKMLQCGHCLSKDSLDKLTRSNRSSKSDWNFVAKSHRLCAVGSLDVQRAHGSSNHRM